MKILSSLTILFLCLGCRIYHPEFVEVVRDHETVTVETCDGLIASIQERIDQETDEDRKQGLIDLQERLQYMSLSSQSISKYVNTNIVDKELLEELIKLQWR